MTARQRSTVTVVSPSGVPSRKTSLLPNGWRYRGEIFRLVGRGMPPSAQGTVSTCRPGKRASDCAGTPQPPISPSKAVNPEGGVSGYRLL